MRISWPAFVLMGLAVAGVVACSSDGDTSPSGSSTGGKPASTPDAGVPPPACSASGPDAAGTFPCDVSAILVAKCQRCHNSREVIQACFEAGTCLKAPFPLLTWSNAHEPYGDGTPIYAHIADAVETGFMPLKATSITPAVQGLTDAEIKVLADWANACAPSGDGACD